MMHWRARRRLSEYLDGSLSERAQRAVAIHLDACAQCRRELAELRATVQLLRSLPELEEPAFLATRIEARIEAGEAAPTWRDRVRDLADAALASNWMPAASAVAALFVVATALQVQVNIQLPWAAAPPQVPQAPAAAPAPFSAPSFSPPPVTLVSRAEVPPGATPVRERRRFDHFVLQDASGVWRACAARPRDAECRSFRRQLVDLALEDPPVFVNEVAAFPPASQERVLSAISMEAARAGHAERVVVRLRGLRDPRVEGIVVRLERPAPSRE
ncbi:MAG: zf-HC2 domain-containing protein [Deltaproteobacteria bacterium]|nr:zf-HC2 domain-containing protein [Deltaproteobacteria bacterium]